ncbi:hypothetical protein QCA50_015376 [Cerrena zonata]|uniref:Uncharacterized protein n=1 Tax=Cerrena zonata TaxID=2478898 RepID=A0AAW0FWG0_9APHY
MDQELEYQPSDLEMVPPSPYWPPPMRSENPDFPVNPLAISTSSQRNGKRDKPKMHLDLSTRADVFIDVACPTDTDHIKFPWDDAPALKGGMERLNLPPQPKTANILGRTTSLNSSSFASHAGSQWRIAPGSFVTFSIDKEALANAFCRSDSPEWKAFMDDPVGKYLGQVAFSISDVCNGEKVERLTIRFAGKTKPSGEQQDCYVPIGNTKRDVNTRSPLRLISFFPWDDGDLVQWTTGEIDIVVRNPKNVAPGLDDDDVDKLELYSADDYRKLKEKDLQSVRYPPMPVVLLNGAGDDPNRFFEEAEGLRELVEAYWDKVDPEGRIVKCYNSAPDADEMQYADDLDAGTEDTYQTAYAVYDDDIAYDADYATQTEDEADSEAVEDMMMLD